MALYSTPKLLIACFVTTHQIMAVRQRENKINANNSDEQAIAAEGNEWGQVPTPSVWRERSGLISLSLSLPFYSSKKEGSDARLLAARDRYRTEKNRADACKLPQGFISTI